LGDYTHTLLTNMRGAIYPSANGVHKAL
jgi:hypothetical protein